MNIIEPRQFAAMKAKKKSRLPKKINFLVLLLCVAGAYLVFIQFGSSNNNDNLSVNRGDDNNESATPQQSVPRKLKTLSANDFKSLYSSFAYPNTQPLQEKPVITGDEEADVRIRNIAESRGYKLSSVPVANIAKTGEPDLDDDDLIQPNALIAWQEMKAAAQDDGITLQMTSAYRSIEAQRTLFVRQMRTSGVYADSVAAGYVDHLVENLLTRVAPPGYSRHHTGYTIDLACDGIGLDAFRTTSCYGWLSKNNYENTKKFGWVPSYPDGADMQGPEPEPWEFIWVSTYSLYE